MTDDEILEKWDETLVPCSDTSVVAFARAIIAARDEELRKQEPVAWRCWNMPDERWEITVNHRKLPAGEPLYAAPIPPAGHYKDALIEDLDNRVEPTPSQQEALDMCEYIEQSVGLKGPTSIIRDFILARPDAPILAETVIEFFDELDKAIDAQTPEASTCYFPNDKPLNGLKP
jgi:hypothetical protein